MSALDMKRNLRVNLRPSGYSKFSPRGPDALIDSSPRIVVLPSKICHPEWWDLIRCEKSPTCSKIVHMTPWWRLFLERLTPDQNRMEMKPVGSFSISVRQGLASSAETNVPSQSRRSSLEPDHQACRLGCIRFPGFKPTYSSLVSSAGRR
ncbi:hypothetical protein BD779DRAFT_1125223 [Infundibulicybe gibba]|nr:hypothetical protein BD779DRAFT_1125223 [Infundibulicybe gibba]